MIPKIIHQIWVGPDPLPAEYAPLIEKLKAMHPGWEHRLWTEDNLPEKTIRDEWRNRLRMPAERSDLLRLELLYTYGGIYLDIDFDMHKPLDSILELAPIVVGDLKPGRINNAFIAAVPGHPVIHKMIMEARPREFFGLDKNASGSLFVSRMLEPHRGGEVKALPPACFYPIVPTEESYATHFSDRSWKQDEGWRKVALRAEQRLQAAYARIGELEGSWEDVHTLRKPSQGGKRQLLKTLLRGPAMVANRLMSRRMRKRLRKLADPSWVRGKAIRAGRKSLFAATDWGSRTLGRPLHRDYLSDLLNRHGLTGQGAEIGVKRGIHSEVILSRWKGRKLYLVDPWEEQNDDSYIDRANVDQTRHNEFYEETLSRLHRFRGRFEVIRDYSVEAAKRVPDGSLDFVYIDARHDFESALEDLRAWYPKVKVGGLIAGHDFLQGMMNGIPYGVKAAVKEFTREHGYDWRNIKRTWEPWPSFYWFKRSGDEHAALPSSEAGPEPRREPTPEARAAVL